ncbi:laccase [Comamonas testosteroni]|uniref:Laccase n=1 Tax=Comamonas testosteroni TaxID=285 RepID=A0A373FUQ5_COMTE|nr:laccase domain-containing protein [Comamonas testosteroni]RGE47149.1 laccase [Comamonas testosteroni]
MTASSARWPPSWLVPDWPAIPGVHAVCTSREGGVSQAPWGSMNLGDHVGDVPVHVQRNRELLNSAIAAQTPGACSPFLQQVHGVEVLALDAGNVAQSNGAAFDACVTAHAGVVCTIMVADCLPVLLAHDSGLVVGAAHAGWRGLAGMPPGRAQADGPLPGGVLETLFESFSLQVQKAYRQSAINFDDSQIDSLEIASHTQAWLGPCIGPESFEVGAEVRNLFIAHDGQAAQHFVAVNGSEGGKYLANLPQLARQRLKALGIAAIYGNDGSAPWCTVSNASRFFSHRRDAARLGSSGRLAACIWRDASV